MASKETSGIRISKAFLGLGLVFSVISCDGTQTPDEAAPTELPKSRLLAQTQTSQLGSVSKEASAPTAEFVPGEIIVKFKAPNRAMADLATPLRKAVSAKSDFTLSSDAILKINGLPKQIRDLVAPETTLQPVFRMLHEEMRTQGKTELEIAQGHLRERAAKRNLANTQPKDFYLSNVYVLKNIKTAVPIDQLSRSLSQDPLIQFAEPNHILRLAYTPQDSYWLGYGSWGEPFEDMYALKAAKINAEAAWDLAMGDGVVVAVLDTGVNYNLPDIAASMWTSPTGTHGYDFVSNDDDPMDSNGHGTFIANIIAATGDNHLGIVGTAFRSKIMAVKINDDETMANGVYYASNHGADIISISAHVGGLTLENATNYAYVSMGVLVVAGVGNDNMDLTGISHEVMNFDHVIAVSGTDQNDEKWNHSNFGDKVEVSAPAYKITSVSSNGSYYQSSGTSFSSPYISGVAALALSFHPTYTNLDLRSVLRQGVDDLGVPGKDPHFGYGRTNAWKTLNSSPIPFYELVWDGDIQIDDSMGNNDGLISPGETVNITVPIKNRSLSNTPLSNINAVMSSNSSLVTIVNPNVYYGSIPSWTVGSGTGVFKVHVSDQAKFGDKFSLPMNLTTGQNYQTTTNVEIKVDLSVHSGWPLLLDDDVSNLVTADLDNDGKDEVIFTEGVKLYALNGDGGTLPGFPVTLGSTLIVGAWCKPPVVGDINGDGFKEIVVMTPVASYGDDSILAYDRTGLLVSGFPVANRNSDFNTPALYNMDNSVDGSLEIITRKADRVFITKGDAALLIDFPVPVSKSLMAVGDINRDGLGEIVLAKSQTIYAFNREGVQPPGWPVTTNITDNFNTDPALADVNGDGQLEVFASSDAALVAVGGNGQLMPSWPSTPNPERGGFPAVGYLGESPVLSLATVHSTGDYLTKLFAIHGADGTTLFSKDWSPTLSAGPGSLLIGDFYGDEERALLIYSENTLRFLSGTDGHEIYSLKTKAATNGYNSPPAVGDIDGDGKAELICSSNGTGKLFAFDLGGARSTWDWPMLSHDAQRTGNFNNDSVTRRAISGTVTDATASGLAGVELRDGANHLLGETKAGGHYGFLMPVGWSGTVTPSKPGHTFEPQSLTYANLSSNQTGQDYTEPLYQFTISGRVTQAGVGIPDVLIKEGPKTVAKTWFDGSYSFKKPYGWTHTICPLKDGYTFHPNCITYTNIKSDQPNQNYSADLIDLTISGRVTFNGRGLPGVSIKEGGHNITSTDLSGSYSFTRSFGWSSLIYPYKEGYDFSPPSRPYSNLATNQEHQDYTATRKNLAISGVVEFNGVGLGGVELREKSSQTLLATTSPSGKYSFEKTYGWSGIVIPHKDAYTFSPLARTYTNITAAQTDQNYRAFVAVTVSGYVRDLSGNALPGVLMQVTKIGSEAPLGIKTDHLGFYQIQVPTGWSGRIAPSSPPYVFDPSFTDYTNVTGNMTQNYMGK